MLRTVTNDPSPPLLRAHPHGDQSVSVRAETGTSIGPELLIPVQQPKPIARTNRDHRGFFTSATGTTGLFANGAVRPSLSLQCLRTEISWLYSEASEINLWLQWRSVLANQGWVSSNEQVKNGPT
jgi:hypothetical protein